MKHKLSPAQEWAHLRNRTKGQLTMMYGALTKNILKEAPLTEQERLDICLAKELITKTINKWERNHGLSKSYFLNPTSKEPL